MILAWLFKAGIESSNIARRVSDAMTHKKVGLFNRRYATNESRLSSYPALKGRAKFTPTLRVGFSD